MTFSALLSEKNVERKRASVSKKEKIDRRLGMDSKYKLTSTSHPLIDKTLLYYSIWINDRSKKLLGEK